jgi:hypothetical protein
VQGIITQVVNEQSTRLSLPFDFDFQIYTEVVVQDAIDILLARFEARLPSEPAIPLMTSISNASDSGYSGSLPSGIGIVDTQSMQPLVDPTLPFLQMSEAPFDGMFMGYQHSFYGGGGTESVIHLDSSDQSCDDITWIASGSVR